VYIWEAQIEEATLDYDRERLQVRLAKLTGVVDVIKKKRTLPFSNLPSPNLHIKLSPQRRCSSSQCAQCH
jgi:hypothetical protein